MRFSGLFPPGRKSDLLFIDRKDTAVGNGDLMGISSEILDRIAKTVERLFDIRAPVLPVKGVFEFLPAAGFLQCPAGGRKNKFLLLVQSIQEGKVLALELIPEYRDRDEEVLFGPSDLPVLCQASAGDDTMHVHMVIQFLVPGVEYLDDAGNGAEVSWVRRKFQECFGTASMEKAVQKLLVTVQKRV